jgi:hypothetical protein
MLTLRACTRKANDAMTTVLRLPLNAEFCRYDKHQWLLLQVCLLCHQFSRTNDGIIFKSQLTTKVQPMLLLFLQKVTILRL